MPNYNFPSKEMTHIPLAEIAPVRARRFSKLNIVPSITYFERKHLAPKTEKSDTVFFWTVVFLGVLFAAVIIGGFIPR